MINCEFCGKQKYEYGNKLYFHNSNVLLLTDTMYDYTDNSQVHNIVCNNLKFFISKFLPKNKKICIGCKVSLSHRIMRKEYDIIKSLKKVQLHPSELHTVEPCTVPLLGPIIYCASKKDGDDFLSYDRDIMERRGKGGGTPPTYRNYFIKDMNVAEVDMSYQGQYSYEHRVTMAVTEENSKIIIKALMQNDSIPKLIIAGFILDRAKLIKKRLHEEAA